MADVNACPLLDLRTIYDHRGSISFVEAGVEVAFDVRRAYWVYDVPTHASRAGHAHRALRQLYIALSGAFEVHLDDGQRQRVVTLSQPNRGLLIGPGIWRELHRFSSNACLLVLASAWYEEDDYIREHAEFLRWVASGTAP